MGNPIVRTKGLENVGNKHKASSAILLEKKHQQEETKGWKSFWGKIKQNPGIARPPLKRGGPSSTQVQKTLRRIGERTFLRGPKGGD